MTLSSSKLAPLYASMAEIEWKRWAGASFVPGMAAGSCCQVGMYAGLAVPVEGGGTFWFAGSYLCTAFGLDGPAVPLPPKGEVGLAPNRVEVVPVPKPPVVAAGLLPNRLPPVVDPPPNVEV
jgi:hypothetical protein